MATKLDPGPYDCYARLDPDEPYFLLRARDVHAPTLVRLWAELRRKAIEAKQKPFSDLAQTQEALNLATEMDRWLDDREGQDAGNGR